MTTSPSAAPTRRATLASLGAALLAFGGLACLGLALQGHLGNSNVRAQVVQSGGGPLMPMALTLDPTMNPMRITVTAKVDERNRAALRNARENYQLSLYRSGRPLLRWQAVLAAEDKDRRQLVQASFSVEPVDVPDAGEYALLLLRPDGDTAPGFAGHEIRVERSGPRAADVKLAWQGAILLPLGVLLQLFLGQSLIFRTRMRGMRE